MVILLWSSSFISSHYILFGIWICWSLGVKAWSLKIAFESGLSYECFNVAFEMFFLITQVLGENFYWRVWFIELGFYCDKFITLCNGSILCFIAWWMTFESGCFNGVWLSWFNSFNFDFVPSVFGQSLFVTCLNVVLNGQAEYCLSGVVMV